ncbi:hypothetical protein Pcinc_019589 [Petrolisthes cinctipes]|uniref:Uncharacterized protein n=1 Tax=Petrolisthes cinctipes TaxID=88211 RepID=A0AAE1FL86_PETCI|nr:hypothetical protein Pcinc_019589 [Petrolisthes cinctipes]
MPISTLPFCEFFDPKIILLPPLHSCSTPSLFTYAQLLPSSLMLNSFPFHSCSTPSLFTYAQLLSSSSMLNSFPLLICSTPSLFTYAQLSPLHSPRHHYH